MRIALIVIILAAVACEGQLGPPEDGILPTPVLPPAGRRVIDANNWRVALASNGSWGYDPHGETGITPPFGFGAEFPAFSGQNGLYAGGLYVGGLKNGVPCVSAIEFASDFQPGFIVNTVPAPIDSLVSSNPDSMRVWIITDDPSSNDWRGWPGDWGAPVEVSGLPRLLSDMDSWTVFNDLNSDTLNYDGSPNDNLGIQVSRRTLMYKNQPLNDVFVLDFEVVNKSNQAYPSAYISLWSDHDLGDASNDVIFTDTTRNMIGVYNYVDGDSWNDQEYAIGYKLLHSSEQQEAKLQSSAWYINGSDPQNDLNRYNLQRGRSQSGGLSVGADSARPEFVWTGDPVTGVGQIDTRPGNRRLIASVGPFTMESGGSYRVVYAVLGASGPTRKDAIVELRKLADKLVYVPD